MHFFKCKLKAKFAGQKSVGRQRKCCLINCTSVILSINVPRKYFWFLIIKFFFAKRLFFWKIYLALQHLFFKLYLRKTKTFSEFWVIILKNMYLIYPALHAGGRKMAHFFKNLHSFPQTCLCSSVIQQLHFYSGCENVMKFPLNQAL